jgi:hypothetical protein
MTRDRPGEPTTGRPHYLGLCSTCVHAPTCVYRIYGGQPVWHCNEFDDMEEPGSPERESSPRVAQDTPLQPADNPSALTGLCMNCAERSHCQLPRPASGVWHCEEYR